jgi:hypothetical protein
MRNDLVVAVLAVGVVAAIMWSLGYRLPVK